MKWFGFSLSILGLFISSHVLAMDPVLGPEDTPSEVREIEGSAFDEQLGLSATAITGSQSFIDLRDELSDSSPKKFSFAKSDTSYSRTFYEQSPKPSDLSLKNSSFATPDISYSEPLFERESKHSHFSLKSSSFAKSDTSYSRTFYEQRPKLSVSSLEKFSFATPDISDSEPLFEREFISHFPLKSSLKSSHNSKLTLEKFSFSTPEISEPKLSVSSLEKFSFATSDLELRSSFVSPSLDLHSLSFLSKPPKSIMREGIVLPKVDLAHLGITNFFNERGIPLGKYDCCWRHLTNKSFYPTNKSFYPTNKSFYPTNKSFYPTNKYEFKTFETPFLLSKLELNTFEVPSLLDKLELKTSETSSLLKKPELKPSETLSLLNKIELKPLEIPSLSYKLELPTLELPSLLCRYVSKENKLCQTAIPDLTDEEIIFLFKHLTSRYPTFFSSDAESMMKLEDLLQDERVPNVILEASKGSEDHISKAFKTATDFLGNPRKLKTLISADGFLEHILSQPADEKGETVLSKAFLHNIFFTNFENLTIFFENKRIWDHLSSTPDEKYQSVVMKALIVAVSLPCGDTLLSTFYESKIIFDHLVSCFSRGDLDAQVISKIFTKVGLLIALSERAEEKINNLLHEGVVNFLREDADFIIQVMKKAIEDRNPYLARRLFADLKLLISPAQIKEALQVSTIWKMLSDENQQTLLATAQKIDPLLTEQGLIRHHKQLTAYEHAIVGHPSVINDMEALAFEGHEKYKNLLTEVLNPFERETQKKVLEREFLKVLCGKTAPWFHAKAQAAYDLRMFGQGINGLVVELDVLPEHHRKGLLNPHLGEETVCKENAKGGRTVHNIGVTPLVTQMAPLAAITSTSTSHLKEIAENITEGKYPFINCSWLPCFEFTDADSPYSIFCSHKELNNLLGRQDVVLIQAAGNASASLSDSASTEDIAGKVFSILLNRLEPNKLTNLILAVNLNPRNTVSESSNTPGSREKIYRHTLSAQGSETFWLDETGHHYRPLQDGGTSSAAPIITGAALLLQSYKRDFSPVLVKTCLLHSAQREFLIYGEDGIAKLGIYETVPSETWKQEKLPQEQFSFSKYGMGILNVKTAFEYADLLETYLNLRGNSEPVTFEEFENLRKKLPLQASRSFQDRVVELEI